MSSRASTIRLLVPTVAVTALIAGGAVASVGAAQGRPATPVEVINGPDQAVPVELSTDAGIDVSGTVEVSNLPSVQDVNVNNFPSDQAVTVENFPSVQDVRVTNSAASPSLVGGPIDAGGTSGPPDQTILIEEGTVLTDVAVLLSVGSGCVFNFRSVPGDAGSTFTTARGENLLGQPLRLQSGLEGPLEIVIACGGAGSAVGGMWTGYELP